MNISTCTTYVKRQLLSNSSSRFWNFKFNMQYLKNY